MPVHVLDVFYRDRSFDSHAASVKSAIRDDLGIIGIEEVVFADSYIISLEGVSDEVLGGIAAKIFIDPLLQDFRLDNPFEVAGSWAVEVKFHGDVTDNIALVAREAVGDFLKRNLGEGEGISWVRKYFIKGNLGEGEVKKICTGLLSNGIIESYTFKMM